MLNPQGLSDQKFSSKPLCRLNCSISMSRPDRLKRQPTANTSPQSTSSFDPIYPKEAKQGTEGEEITGAVEEKREGRQKSRGGRNPSVSQK
jgi:hypothetical protein